MIEPPNKKLLEELVAQMLKEQAEQAFESSIRPRPRSWPGWEQICYDFNRQQRCKHVKGGLHAFAPRTSVHRHQFIDGSEKIWCAYCPFQVWNKPEFTFKWQFGLKLWENGCEHMSTSERPVPEFQGPEAMKPSEFRFKDVNTPIDKVKSRTLQDNEGPIKGGQPSVLDWRPE